MQVKAEKPAWYLAVISGALLRTLDFVAARSAEYLSDLEKGQLPPARLTLTAFEETFVLEGAPPARACPPAPLPGCAVAAAADANAQIAFGPAVMRLDRPRRTPACAESGPDGRAGRQA